MAESPESPELYAPNTRRSYERLSTAGPSLAGPRRWIGRCKKCGKTARLEGELATAHAPGHHELVVRDALGMLWTTAGNGTDPTLVWAPCGDHHVLLRRVTEGKKSSKHECGACCINATGPSCDCRCKGKNHGMNC